MSKQTKKRDRPAWTKEGKSIQDLHAERFGWWRCLNCDTVNLAAMRKCKQCGLWRVHDIDVQEPTLISANLILLVMFGLMIGFLILCLWRL